MAKTTKHFQNDISVKGVQANGSFGTPSQVLTSNGSSTFWGSIDLGANPLDPYVGSGISASSTIQSILDNDGVVEFPSGDLLVDTPIILPTGARIIGRNRKTSRLIKVDYNGPVLLGEDAEELTLENFTIVGPGQWVGTGNKGIDLRTSLNDINKKIKLDSITITGMNDIGAYLGSAAFVEWDGVSVLNCGYASIFIEGGDGHTLTGCSTQGSLVGLLINNAGGYGPTTSVINGFYGEQHGRGVWIQGGVAITAISSGVEAPIAYDVPNGWDGSSWVIEGGDMISLIDCISRQDTVGSAISAPHVVVKGSASNVLIDGFHRDNHASFTPPVIELDCYDADSVVLGRNNFTSGSIDSGGKITDFFVEDGDKGDITVSNGVWTIDNSVVTNTKMANVASFTIKGRMTAGSGVVEDLTASQAKTVLGLGNVDNTSDLAKPVSTATQTALNAKANINSPIFTGEPHAPQPSNSDNSTRIATTGYVMNQGYAKTSALASYATTASLLSYAPLSGANFTGNITSSGNYFQNRGANPSYITIASDSAYEKYVRFGAGSNRNFDLGVNGNGDLFIKRCNPADGSLIDTPFMLRGSTGNLDLTGQITASTPATADNSTKVATTAFVKAQGYATTASLDDYVSRTAGATITGTLNFSGFSSTNPAINLMNGDVIRANGIWFSDTNDSLGEGLNFPKPGADNMLPATADHWCFGITGAGAMRVDNTVIYNAATGKLTQAVTPHITGSEDTGWARFCSNGSNSEVMGSIRLTTGGVSAGYYFDGAQKWTVNNSGNMSCTGTFTAGGIITGTQLRCDAANNAIFASGSTTPNVVHRNDGSNYYILLTNAVAGYSEAYNALRPLYINVSNGRLYSNNGQTFAGGMTVTGAITASGNITGASDKRLKENVETIPDALSKVQQMRGVHFDWKESGEASTGVIAQELQQIAPELVHESDNDDKTLSVGYMNLTAYLIEAVKELSAKVEYLEAKLEKGV